MAALFAVAGCGSEEGLRVCFDAPGARLGCDDDPACVDTLEVGAALWSSDSFCEPAPITTSAVLPYCVAIEPGRRYADGVAVRADLLGAGTLRARREIGFSFEEGTIVDQSVQIEAACFDAALPCADDEQCVDGACEPLPFGPRVFDAPQSDVTLGDACSASPP